jgi:hypothetical protein
MNQAYRLQSLHEQKKTLIDLIEKPAVNNDIKIGYMLCLREVLRNIRTLDPQSQDVSRGKIDQLTHTINTHASERVPLQWSPLPKPTIEEEKKCGCFNFFQR